MYKMIGPVLVRQDTLEARSNVDKRLEFIGGGWMCVRACGRMARWRRMDASGGSGLRGPAAACPTPTGCQQLLRARLPAGEIKRLDSQLQQLEEKQSKKQAQVGGRGDALALAWCHMGGGGRPGPASTLHTHAHIGEASDWRCFCPACTYSSARACSCSSPATHTLPSWPASPVGAHTPLPHPLCLLCPL